MNLMNLLTGSAQFNDSLSQIGSRVGLTSEQTQNAVTALLPALIGGLKQHKGEADLSAVLTQSGLTPGAAVSDQTTDLGNQILGKIFGSKDVSRQVASNASATTGIDADKLKLLLPLLASLSAGTLSSKAQNKGGNGGFLDMLDFDGDGSPLNDIAGLAGKFFNR